MVVSDITSNDITCIMPISESEKSKVYLASVAGIAIPVIVKELLHVEGTDRIEFYQYLQSLNCPMIPILYKVWQEDSTIYVVEENVEGKTLREIIDAEELTVEMSRKIMLGLCNTVSYFHKLTPPIIHRDIKPENLLIIENGEVRLIDFDAARQYRDFKRNDTQYLGTPDYAAPEQYGFTQTDARSDIYAIGIVLSDLLKGIKAADLSQADNAEDRQKIKEVVDKCTRFDPKQRYRDVTEVQDALEAIFEHKREKRVLAIWSVVIALLAIVYGALLYQNQF